jgi:hypothetical protein
MIKQSSKWAHLCVEDHVGGDLWSASNVQLIKEMVRFESVFYNDIWFQFVNKTRFSLQNEA